jgi:PTH1 family peptidyl-tRNA hydrolase
VKLILLGLGNPGLEYRNSRHNLGHRFIDNFSVSKESTLHDYPDLHVVSFEFFSSDVYLVKSKHFMNSSGNGMVDFLRKVLGVDDIFMIVHDELNLPFGRAKLSQGKSAGGHNGVASVINSLGFSPPRLRLGINSNRDAKKPLSEFVLSDLSEEEQKSFDCLLPKLIFTLKLLVLRGFPHATNFINRHPLPTNL